MKSLITAIFSIFGAQPVVDMGNIMCQGFKEEHPSVEEARQRAKAKMGTWGRKSLMDGGDFTRQFTVLREKQLSMF